MPKPQNSEKNDSLLQLLVHTYFTLANTTTWYLNEAHYELFTIYMLVDLPGQLLEINKHLVIIGYDLQPAITGEFMLSTSWKKASSLKITS